MIETTLTTYGPSPQVTSGTHRLAEPVSRITWREYKSLLDSIVYLENLSRSPDSDVSNVLCIFVVTYNGQSFNTEIQATISN